MEGETDQLYESRIESIEARAPDAVRRAPGARGDGRPPPL